MYLNYYHLIHIFSCWLHIRVIWFCKVHKFKDFKFMFFFFFFFSCISAITSFLRSSSSSVDFTMMSVIKSKFEILGWSHSVKGIIKLRIILGRRRWGTHMLRHVSMFLQNGKQEVPRHGSHFWWKKSPGIYLIFKLFRGLQKKPWQIYI